MKRYDGDLEATSTRKIWRKLYELADAASKVYDEEQRIKKGKSKIFSEEDEDKRFGFLAYVPRKVRSSLRYPHENLNGASTSSSLHHLRRCFESCSSLLYNTAETKSPNSQTKNISRKRVLPQTMNSTRGKFKKTKVASLPRVARETPEWLVEVMTKMNTDEDPPRLVFEKPLSASDVNSNLSRLLIPFNQLTRNDFLTPAESQAIEREDVDEENIGVGTILVNKNSEKWGLRFKIWLMEKNNSGNGTSNYSLNWGWNDVVKCNNLKARDEISLWSFRCRGILCFALEHRVP